MDYQDLTLKQINEIKNLGCSTSTGLVVGQSYFFRTVTYHYVGIVESVNEHEVTLSQASWVADSGRWNKALVTGELKEVEPYPYGVTVRLHGMIDYSPWKNPLPTTVK